MRRLKLSFIAAIVSILVLAAVAAIAMASIADFSDGYSEKRAEQVEEIVVHSAQQCYALEGAYPPSIAYLADNYGLVVDTDRYIYHYDMFATNILPDVRVFERRAGE